LNDDEDEQSLVVRKQKNKVLLLEWVVEADFTKEISLAQLGQHPFNLNEDEEDINLTQIVKILKM
jgi:hypothetical protein